MAAPVRRLGQRRKAGFGELSELAGESACPTVARNRRAGYHPAPDSGKPQPTGGRGGRAVVVEARTFPAETQRRRESAEPGPRITTLGGIGEETLGLARAEEDSPSLRSNGRLAIGRRLTTCPTRGGPWWTGQGACPTALRGRVSGENTGTALERIGSHAPSGRRTRRKALGRIVTAREEMRTQ